MVVCLGTGTIERHQNTFMHPRCKSLNPQPVQSSSPHSPPSHPRARSTHHHPPFQPDPRRNTSMSDLPHRPNPDFLAYLTDIAALPFRPSQSQANGRRRKSNVNFFPSSYLRCRMSHTTILHSAVGGVIARNRLTAHSSSQPRCYTVNPLDSAS